MDGVIRQLYDYDGSNLFPRTRPNALVSDFEDSTAVGIRTIGEHIDSSTPTYEPEFVYRVKGSDPNATVDSSGDLHAAKISDIPGLLGAVLVQELVVTNPFGLSGTQGSAYWNGTTSVYPVGTPLETIIVEMLTAGATAYDVAKTLVSAQFISVTINGTSISNGDTRNMAEGETARISFVATYTDGYFSKSANYPEAVFDALHSSQASFDPDTHRLYALTLPTGLKLTRAGSAEYSASSAELATLSTAGQLSVTAPDITIPAGQQVYVLSLTYSGQVNTVQPKKSDGTNSNQTINGGTSTYSFTIVGAQATAYDVVLNSDPKIMSMTTPIGFGVDVFDSNFDIANASTYNFIIKSKYDIDNNTSTGIWNDDSAVLFVKKALYPSWSLTDPDTGNPWALPVNNVPEQYTVQGPCISFADGMFSKESEYPLNTYRTNNPRVDQNGTLFAGCELNTAPTLGIYKGSTPVKTTSVTYDTIADKFVVNSTDNWDHSIHDIPVDSAICFKSVASGTLDMNSTTFASSGTYKLKLTVPYSENTVIPKKSDNNNSDVSVAAGTGVIESNTFEVKQEVNVSVGKTPTIAINKITIGSTDYSDGASVPATVFNGSTADGSTADGSTAVAAIVHYTYTDGYFIPANSTYTTDEFDNNNAPNASNGRLPGGTSVNGLVTLRLNNADTSTGTGGTINTLLPSTLVGQEASFVVKCLHTDSTATPKKRSRRPSDDVSMSVANITSDTFRLIFSGIETKGITAKTAGNGAVRIKAAGGSWSGWSNATDNSSVSMNVAPGTEMAVEASASSGYTFEKWTSNNASIDDSTSNPYTFNTPVPGANATVTAIFVQIPVTQPTARLLTTDKVLVPGTNQLLSSITSIDGILAEKINGTDEWSNTVPASISNSPEYTFSSKQTYGQIGSAGKTIVAIVPATWNLKNIELQCPEDDDNEFYGPNGGTFDNLTSTSNNIFDASDGIRYKVYAKINTLGGAVDVKKIKFVKQ